MLIERELRQLRLLEAASHKLVQALCAAARDDSEAMQAIRTLNDCMQDYENECRVPPKRVRPTVSAALLMLLGNFLLAFALRAMRRYMTDEQAERFVLLAQAIADDKRWGT